MDRTELAVLAGMLIGGVLVYGVMKWQARWARRWQFPQHVPPLKLSPLAERVQCCLEETELADAQRCEYRYGVQYSAEQMGKLLSLRHKYQARRASGSEVR